MSCSVVVLPYARGEVPEHLERQKMTVSANLQDLHSELHPISWLATFERKLPGSRQRCSSITRARLLACNDDVTYCWASLTRHCTQKLM